MLGMGLTPPVSCSGESPGAGQDLLKGKASEGTKVDGNKAAGVVVALNQKVAPGLQRCGALELPSRAMGHETLAQGPFLEDRGRCCLQHQGLDGWMQ